MVTHIVIFTWIPCVTDAQLVAFGQALDRLAALRSDIVTIRHGPDLAFREGNGDHALVATFTDKERWVEYQADPAHKAFVRDFVTPIQASRLTIQF
ncbi:MAG TPA: Dabb family protein [Novosphingobium sp.]|nr:Dabb family protein [Novosphingobium sp.]